MHPKITPRLGWYHILKIIKKINWGTILTCFMAQIKIVKLSTYSGSYYYVGVIYETVFLGRDQFVHFLAGFLYRYEFVELGHGTFGDQQAI